MLKRTVLPDPSTPTNVMSPGFLARAMARSSFGWRLPDFSRLISMETGEARLPMPLAVVRPKPAPLTLGFPDPRLVMVEGRSAVMDSADFSSPSVQTAFWFRSSILDEEGVKLKFVLRAWKSAVDCQLAPIYCAKSPTSLV